MWQPQLATVGNGRVGERHLQHGDAYGALADRGIERVPDHEAFTLAVGGGLGAVPFFRGHEAGLLVVESQARRCPEPKLVGKLGHPIHHSRPCAQVVEEDVAALHDGVVQVDHLVHLGAAEAAPAHLDVASAAHLVLESDELLFQCGGGGDDLKGRARVVGVSQSFVTEGAQPVAQDARYRFGGEAARHQIGVEAGLGCEGEDAAGFHVEKHRRRCPRAPQRALDNAL